MKRTLTKRIIIKYARFKVKHGWWDWERIADEIRNKELDYIYYETFFTFYRNGMPAGYDWVNGNDKWKLLIQRIKDGITTKQLLTDI